MRAQVYAWLGVEPPRGILLHGPPGCGKTALAHAIAHETRVPFLRISAPEIVAGVSGAQRCPLLPQHDCYSSCFADVQTVQA
jgi:ribosome biogenesis ATPase